MCFTTFSQNIWIDYIENITREKGKAQFQIAGLNVTIHYANFFVATIYSNCSVSAYILPTIPAICMSNFFSVKMFILSSLWPLCIEHCQKLVATGD